MDAFNREFISVVIIELLNYQLAMGTLKQAMKGREVKGVMLHSD